MFGEQKGFAGGSSYIGWELWSLFNPVGMIGRGNLRKKYGLPPGNPFCDGLLHGILCFLVTAQEYREVNSLTMFIRCVRTCPFAR